MSTGNNVKIFSEPNVILKLQTQTKLEIRLAGTELNSETEADFKIKYGKYISSQWWKYSIRINE